MWHNVLQCWREVICLTGNLLPFRGCRDVGCWLPHIVSSVYFQRRQHLWTAVVGYKDSSIVIEISAFLAVISFPKWKPSPNYSDPSLITGGCVPERFLYFRVPPWAFVHAHFGGNKQCATQTINACPVAATCQKQNFRWLLVQIRLRADDE